MIVYHDDVKLEVGLLSQRTLHSISHRLFAVEDGDDDRCLVFKILLTEVGLAVEGGVYQGTHLAQILGACLFHLYLHLAVARVYIVKLLLAALTGVEFGF